MLIKILWIIWTFLNFIVTRGYGKYTFLSYITLNVISVGLLSFCFKFQILIGTCIYMKMVNDIIMIASKPDQIIYTLCYLGTFNLRIYVDNGPI